LIAGTAIFATAASAQQFGTADEAKAMLTKTVSALKADKAKTLDLINEGKDASTAAAKKPEGGLAAGEQSPTRP
jgi:hypothetical protein